MPNRNGRTIAACQLNGTIKLHADIRLVLRIVQNTLRLITSRLYPVPHASPGCCQWSCCRGNRGYSAPAPASPSAFQTGLRSWRCPYGCSAPPRTVLCQASRMIRSTSSLLISGRSVSFSAGCLLERCHRQMNQDLRDRYCALWWPFRERGARSVIPLRR